ncbi:MAG: hypothetical protein ABEJ03_04605 [Candidatus Nanohaloarchaea archaeon]
MYEEGLGYAAAAGLLFGYAAGEMEDKLPIEKGGSKVLGSLAGGSVSAAGAPPETELGSHVGAAIGVAYVSAALGYHVSVTPDREETGTVDPGDLLEPDESETGSDDEN